MHSITKEFGFCAAHRIEGHPKCGRMHGHNYKVIVNITGLLDRGMVMDFGDVKRAVGPIIDQMDHRFLVSDANLHATDRAREYATLAIEVGDAFILGTEHSTAEEIAQMLHSKICRALHLTPNKLSITVFEQDESSAIYQG